MPNNDLISRKALLETFEKLKDNPNNQMVEIIFLDGAMSVIDNAPDVDAEPVRRGSWGECRITGYDGLHAVYTRPCSECGHEARFSTNYCPICGAKMDKEET
jgi:rubrerythrin